MSNRTSVIVNYMFSEINRLRSVVMRGWLIGIPICIVLVASSNPAWAHRFNLGFVIPMSGSQLESGQHALDGFMLATGEQDAHAFEESDGHLGGLDSYLFTIDSTGEQGILLGRLEGLLEEQEPIFVTGIFTVKTKKMFSQFLGDKRVVLVDPVDSLIWRIAIASPEKLAMINGGSFSTEFQRRYNYAPNYYVLQGYLAARLIAATVRSLTENQLRDPRELAQTLSRVQRELR